MPLTFSNLKKKQIGETGNDGTLNVEMILTLNYLSNIWKYLELPLFNSKISLILNWSVNFVVSSNAAVKQTTPFAITNTELYVPVLPLSTQNKVELLQQLKWGFKYTIILNKYQSKVSTQAQSQYLDCFVDPSFQELNKTFMLLLENNASWRSHKRFFQLFSQTVFHYKRQ